MLPHLRSVYRLAVRLVGNVTAAEDLTQETYLKAMQAFPGHPVRHAALRSGESVLDLGCGAGIDTFLAARAVGPTGHVVGIDMTPEMVERARRNIEDAGVEQVEIHEGLIEELPLPDKFVDVVISNGVLNLSTRKSRVLAEAFRVLRPDGRLVITDLVMTEALPEDVLKSPASVAG